MAALGVVAAVAAPILPFSSSFAASQKSRLSPAAAAAAETASAPATPVSAYRFYASSSRRNAIDKVKSSPDLEAALSSVVDVLEVQDCNLLLRHYGNSRRWAEVSKLFKWMQKHGRLNVPSYSGYFKYMGISHNPSEVLQVYTSIQDNSLKVDVSICNSVLGCMVRNGRYKNSFELFDQMKYGGLSPDLVTYNTLLKACIKLKNGYAKAIALIEELESKDLRMDGVMYGTILAICASHNCPAEADMYFQMMKDDDHQPNLYHYSSLLNACAIQGNYMKAEALIEEMKSLGLTPDKIILVTLLKVYSKCHMFEKARKLLSELEASGFAEDEMPYCVVIDGLAKGGNIQEAKNLFAEMKKKGIKSDGYAYSIMISSLCRCGLLQEARLLAKEFEANNGAYDIVTLNALLRAYCNTGDMESVRQLLKKMDGLNISPDWHTFDILIKFFCHEKLYHLAFKSIEDMHSKGHPLNEELCSSMIIHLGEAGYYAEAYSVYNMLRYGKRTVCKSLHEKMLGILVAGGLLKDAYVVMKDNTELLHPHALEKFACAFMKSGNINMINDVFKALHRSGREIGPDIFRRAILRYLEKPDKKDLLLHLLEWMTGQGYCVDSSSRNLLLQNAHIFGQKRILADILSKQQVMSRKVRNSKDAT